MAIFDDKLHSIVFGVHISHFALDAGIAHDRWGEDHGKIFGIHLGMVSGYLYI